MNKTAMTEAAFMKVSNLARISDAARLLNEVHENPLPLEDTVMLRRMKIELLQLKEKLGGSIKTTETDESRGSLPAINGINGSITEEQVIKNLSNLKGPLMRQLSDALSSGRS